MCMSKSMPRLLCTMRIFTALYFGFWTSFAVAGELSITTWNLQHLMSEDRFDEWVYGKVLKVEDCRISPHSGPIGSKDPAIYKLSSSGLQMFLDIIALDYFERRQGFETIKD